MDNTNFNEKMLQSYNVNLTSDYTNKDFILPFGQVKPFSLWLPKAKAHDPMCRCKTNLNLKLI